MKKIIGILTIVIFSLVMFTNTNVANNTNTDMTLDNLVALNEASAQLEWPGWSCDPGWGGKCSWTGRCFFDTTADDCRH